MGLALQKEIEKDYVKAVELYEKDIEGKASVESYSNLAFLYWCFAFELFEFNIPNNISEVWSKLGGERYSEILRLGLDKYPNSRELIFWKRYFAHIIFGENFTEEDCRQIIQTYKDDESIVPYFFLYLFDKKKYVNEKNALLIQCNKTPVAKFLYIKSVLNNS